MVQNAALPKFVVLDSQIPYDNDDYNVWADTLLNTETMEIKTVSYGHGCVYEGYNSTISLQDAIAAGLDADDLYERLYKRHFSGSVSPFVPCSGIAIPCTVVGGRKFRGEGILVGIVEVADYYVGYGDHTYSLKAKVLDPATNNIYTINSVDYIEFAPEVLDRINALVARQRYDYVKRHYSLQQLAHLDAYRISYASCDVRYIRSVYSNNEFINLAEEFGSTLNGTDVEEQAKNEKERAFKEKKIADLTEWAKSKNLHCESEEELQKFVEFVYKKNYGFRY